MPAKAKLTDTQVKTIRRRVRAGALLSELARAYGVNRKTIRRRLDALERAEAKRGRSEPRRAEATRPQRPLEPNERKPKRAPEQWRRQAAAGPSPPSAAAAHARRPGSAPGRRRARGGRLVRFRPGSYAAWLDERDARLPAPPDPRVRLVTKSGRTVGSTCASNAGGMAAALEPRHGPLRVVPDLPVRLVNESGRTVSRARESNGERIAAALETRHGPLRVVPD